MSREIIETKIDLVEIGNRIGIKIRVRVNLYVMKIIEKNVKSQILVKRVILDAVKEDLIKKKRIEIIGKVSLTTIYQSGHKSLI
jgi:hypothetical protein